MNYFIVFLVLFSVIFGVLAFENQPAKLDQSLPLLRVRRGGSNLRYRVKCLPGDGECWATVGGRGTIFQNNDHKFDASAYAAKDVSTNLNIFKPERTGAAVDYSYKPSQSGIKVEADHAKGYGTDVSASGRYNFVQNKDFKAGIEASINKHYGGPMGNGPSDKAVFLKAEAKI